MSEKKKERPVPAQVCAQCGGPKLQIAKYTRRGLTFPRCARCTNAASIRYRAKVDPKKRQWMLSDGHLRNGYGIDAEHWARMYEFQNGKCAGCGFVLKFDCSTHIDHDHSTLEVRGLLCFHCNSALGYARDNIDILANLVGYLEAHGYGAPSDEDFDDVPDELVFQ